MKQYNDFDWRIGKQSFPEEAIEFLKLNHDSPMSEGAFVKMWCELPRTGREPSRIYSPSKARSTYQWLSRKFGFFGGSNGIDK